MQAFFRQAFAVALELLQRHLLPSRDAGHVTEPARQGAVTR